MNESALIEKLNWRYAVKRFDPSKKLSPGQWEALEKALILTPSSYGLQPWKFIIVQNPSVRAQLKAASWNQTQVEDCSHFVVLAGKNSVDEKYVSDFLTRTAEVRKVPKESMNGYEQMMMGDLVKGPRSKIIPEWTARQCYIALGNLMTACAILGVDACPMEGLDPVKYDDILKLNGTGYRTVVACAVGFRHAEDKYAQAPKVRFTKNELIQTV